MGPTADRLWVECSRLSAAAHLNRWAASSSGEGTPEKPSVGAAVAQPITVLVSVSFNTILACIGNSDRLPYIKVLERQKTLWVFLPISSL